MLADSASLVIMDNNKRNLSVSQQNGASDGIIRSKKKFLIEIEEILQRVIEIKAESLADAIFIVNNMYKNQDIILDADDLKSINIGEVIDDGI